MDFGFSFLALNPSKNKSLVLLFYSVCSPSESSVDDFSRTTERRDVLFGSRFSYKYIATVSTLVTVMT